MADNRKRDAPQTFDLHRPLPVRQQAHGHLARPGRTDKDEPAKEPVAKKRRLWKRWLFSIVLLVLAFFIFIGAWDARNISRASQEMFGSANLVSLIRGGGLTTDSHGRVNVLLVGYSADDPGHQGAQLTDSILLLSMNPANHTGYLLSIPRDLYVNLGSDTCQSSNQYCKINEAYEDGGMGLLEQTINSDFQVSVNYYAIIDYTAVRDIVSALGGVTVNIQSPDPRGLYDPNISNQDGRPLLLKNGPQTVDGQTALNLTRARGDAVDSYGFPQSDFDRTQHQRQIFTAIKEKLNWKLVLNPRKNSQILQAVSANVKTNLPVSAVRPLFGLFNAIPNSKLQSLSLNSLNGTDLLQSYSG